MKSVIKFSLNNKFAIWLFTIIVLVSGLYSGLTMKQESMPNLSLPFLNVTTVYPGAAPDSVVEDVTAPLEQRLRNLDNVNNVTSTSMENASNIMIEFEFGQDMNKAVTDVREALDLVELPSGAQSPSISKFSINSFPILSLSAAGGEDLEHLTNIVDSEIKPALEEIEGVASVSVAGQYVREVQLTFDQAKMAQYGLTEDTVSSLVQAAAVKAPLGLFQLDDSEKSIVVDGQVTSIEELRNLTIPAVGGAASAGGAPGGAGGAAGTGAAAPGAGAGAPGTDAGAAGTGAGAPAAPMGLPTVKLGDIATLELVGQAESVSRTNGKESIGIQIVKANDANTVEVVNAVKDEAERFQEKYPDMELVVLLDQGKPIEESVLTMLEKALFGAIFAIIIILLFLRNIRSTIISVVSIPLSLIMGVLLLKQFDISLNIMTLGAMTVAIGRVVDDSIVVIENIYRRMALSGEKLKGKELILDATREMFMPIMSSTIVTIAVFLPIALVSGLVGQLFLPFALTMVFTLLASLLVAITIVPMMAHSMFRNGVKAGKADHHEKPGKMAEGYKKMLSATLRHKVVTVVAAFALLVGSFFLVPLIGTSFLPEEEEKYMMITYSPEPGALLDDVTERALQAESFLLEQPDVTSMQYSIGGGGNPLAMGSSSNSGLFYLQFDPDVSEFEAKKEAIVTELQQRVPEGTWSQMDMTGGMGGSSFSLGVYGESLDQIKPVADQIADIMKQDSSFEDVETSLSETFGQYTLVADHDKLSQLGLTAGQLAMRLMPNHERPILTTVEEEGQTYNVYVQVDNETFGSIADIENATLQSPLGVEVPIKDVAAVEEGTAPSTVTRENGRMVVTVSGAITSNDVGAASAAVQEKVDEMDLPTGVEVKIGGVTEQINETFSQLGLAMAAAIAIVYLVLVLTFGGGLAPFAIMFSLPFAIIGGLVALWLAGETLSVSALMGALMLIGIVVTNAIVLIDRAIHNEKAGMTVRESLLEAAGTRLRPILMTALATIGSLLPLVFGIGGGGGIISRGLAVTVVGGLISSTLLTLFIVPIAYEVLMRFRRKPRED